MKAVLLALAIGMGASEVVAQDAVSTERLRFAKGATSASAAGSVRGYATKIYVVGARAGQAMAVNLKTSNASNYFTVIAPGANDALFDGTINGGSFKGKAPASGDYRINVFLMRNAARRNETGKYTISIAIK